MSTRILMVYKRFERAWHWSQVALIMMLLFSGFAVRGIHHLIDFRTAVVVHTAAALALLVIWAFATFWLFTTGDYKHYLPSKEGMFAVIRYYTLGIFMNEEHPYHKVFWRKHNPLQAMSYVPQGHPVPGHLDQRAGLPDLRLLARRPHRQQSALAAGRHSRRGRLRHPRLRHHPRLSADHGPFLHRPRPTDDHWL